ncbi:hypothetical protein ACX9NE_13210 [Mycobacterium sp. ML4]
MTFAASTVSGAVAWRPDLYESAIIDVVADALILTCTTVASDVDGDQPS